MRRITKITPLIALGSVMACDRADMPRGYQGISDSLPTGSVEISANGLAAAYDMESFTAGGRLRDFSGNGNHGETSQRAATDGIMGAAMRFADVADRIDLPEGPSFDLSGPMTVAVWLKVSALDLHQHVFACDDKFALWITPQNQFRLGDTQGNGYSTPGLIEAGIWYSVAGVLYGTQGDSLTPENIQVYVNGSPTEGTMDPTWNPTVLHPDDACSIGFESHQGNARHQELQFEGVIDEILVFSRALTEREIQAHATHRPPS